MELLPEIKTSSSDDRASEWLERGVVDCKVRVVDGNLEEERPETQQAVMVNPKKQLRWEWRNGKVEVGDGLLKVIEQVDEDGRVLTEHRAE